VSKVNLIKSEIDKLTEPGDYRDIKLPGFVMTVSTVKKLDLSGKETTIINRYYKVHARLAGGKAVKCSIGMHGVVTPAEAREKARQILAQIKTGVNPNEQKRQAKQERQLAADLAKKEDERRSYVLRNALDEYLAFKASSSNGVKQSGELSPSTAKLYRRVIEAHLVDWLDMPIMDITRDMVLERHQKVSQKSLASAGNTFRALRGIINWVISRYEGKYLNANPVNVLSALNAWKEVKPRDSVIADTQLKAWWQEVSKPCYGYHSDYFKLLLLTGLRKNELAGMKWSDVDFSNRFWTVRNTKNGRDHSLPFSKETERILVRRFKERTQSIYVFPGKGTEGCIRDVERAQYQIVDAIGVEFTPHDLRRTFISIAARELPDYLVKRFANHHDKQNITQAHYVVLKDMEALRPSLQSIEDFIMSHVNSGKKKALQHKGFSAVRIS
jgi:integrase